MDMCPHPATVSAWYADVQSVAADIQTSHPSSILYADVCLADRINQVLKFWTINW